MQTGMLERLARTARRFDEIDGMLASPEVLSNTDTLRELMKERKAIEPTVLKYREYTAKLRALEDAEALSGDTSLERELRELADEEADELRACLPALEDALRILLLPRDENDDKNVIMEIRAGAGGEEAALFAADLYRMYGMYADTVGFRIEPMSANETELGGFREISFTVSGEGAFSRLKFESGVHRVQRVPRTESQGRIQTSTVTVAVLPEVEEIDIRIDPADLEIETCKSSGAGGQHINKTESAIRILHRPSGIVVFCQEERSQFKNRDKALRMLRAKLYEAEATRKSDERADARRLQVGTGDRSEKIRTYNYPQSRVTDHRIGLTLYQLDSFMNGDIGDMLDALATADTEARLKGQEYAD